MSSFFVGTDHVDYLVSAVQRFAPHRLAGTTPQELGRRLLAENIATVTFRGLTDDGDWITDDEWMDAFELEEVEEERASLDAVLAAYRFRPVVDLGPAQAASVAACWQYQRGREDWDDLPPTWVTADAVIEAALQQAPGSAFRDPSGSREFGNLDTDGLRWGWSRAGS